MPAGDTLAAAAERTCSRIGGYASEVARHAPVPGGVIAVADEARQLAHASFGHADIERGHLMSTGHLFEIGSISKIFTSLLVGQLAAESRLSLDDPATKFLPWLDVGRGARPATLRALLSHTAGLVLGSDALPDDLAQVWRMRHLAVDTGRARFHYSNLGYQVLGLVASACTGQHLPDLVSERLLEPMGMASSVPAVTHADRSRLAAGYAPARQDRPWVPGDPLSPAPWFEVASADGNIASTGPDMARLIMLLLGRGEVLGRRIVAERVLDSMTTSLAPDGEPVAPLPGIAPVTSSRYGLGINVETIAGNRCLAHGGGMAGYSSFLLTDTSAGAGVVVLTNADGDSPHAQLLARAAHTDLLSRLYGGETPALPPADPLARRGGPYALPPDSLGRFTAAAAAGVPLAVTLSEDAGGAAVVEAEGREGRLYRTLTGRHVTDHPDLRRFPLDLVRRDGRPAWVHGPAVYVHDRGEAARAGSAGVDRTAGQGTGRGRPEPPAAWRALTGHYRCYSPWYPELRIFIRDGALWLAAAGGVEAPSQDERLTEIEPGTFRVGAGDWLPERLIAGPVVDGRVISLDRDGCVYSRTFTP